MKNCTTRRYPRTLSEAFPSGYEYAASIERQRRSDWSAVWIIVIMALLTMAPWVILALWS